MTGLGRPRALVIAHSVLHRAQLRKSLERAECHVSSANGGHQAMILAREQRPDLVIIDLPLTLLPAETVISALRAEHSSTLPLLALTGRGQYDLAANLNAYAIVERPFHEGALVAAIQHGLALAQRSRPRPRIIPVSRGPRATLAPPVEIRRVVPVAGPRRHAPEASPIHD